MATIALLAPFILLSFRCLGPNERVSPHKDPAALDKGYPHPCVSRAGDPPLMDVLPCRIFGGRKPYVRSDLFRSLESCEVL